MLPNYPPPIPFLTTRVCYTLTPLLISQHNHKYSPSRHCNQPSTCPPTPIKNSARPTLTQTTTSPKAAKPSTTATPAVQVRFPCPSSRTRRQSSSPTTLGPPIRKRRSVCLFLNPHSRHPLRDTVLNEFVQQNAMKPKQWTSPTSSRDAILVVPLNPQEHIRSLMMKRFFSRQTMARPLFDKSLEILGLSRLLLFGKRTLYDSGGSVHLNICPQCHDHCA
jgi:hypothetical protein